jgi:hypothetical protein
MTGGGTGVGAAEPKGTPPASPLTVPRDSTEPGPPRTCRSANDCEIAWLTLDCCGSAAAIGVTHGSAKEVERRSQESPPFAGSCECLAAPTRLDDGTTATAPSDVVVMCEADVCATRRAQEPTATTTPAPTAALTAAPAATTAPAPTAAPTSAPAPKPERVEAPVRCKSTYDCWVTGYPARAVARPKGVHHRFRGCIDGEVPPRCTNGVCGLGLRFGC